MWYDANETIHQSSNKVDVGNYRQPCDLQVVCHQYLVFNRLTDLKSHICTF